MNITLSAKYRIRALLRENSLTDSRVEALLGNERLPDDRLRALQEHELRKTLEAAGRRLPAYNKLRVPAGDIFKFLETLPIITKESLLSDRRNFAPTLGSRRLWTPRGLTSGTTGTPLEVYRSFDSVLWESAFLQRHWHWSGFARGMKRATLRGDNIVPVSQTAEPFWFFSKADNQLILSSRHLKEPYIQAIADRIDAFSPHILQAYPSTAHELAAYLERVGEELHIPYVYTSSEMLYAHQRELIESKLNTKIMDHYGMAERVAIITQCEHGNYHVNSDYSYVEVLDESGSATENTGYIVGTTFRNTVMPLIRYKLSDRVRWKRGACACGRTYPMIETIEGRSGDTVYGSHGGPISPSIITFVFKGLRHIERSQVAQVGSGRWEIRVVPLPGYGESERSRLVKNIHELVDSELDITVVEQTDIPRTSTGKYRWIVNEWTASSPDNRKDVSS